MSDTKAMHPHDMVAAALGSPGSALNGGPHAPGGEELETVIACCVREL
jgi:hypothetical protein